MVPEATRQSRRTFSGGVRAPHRPTLPTSSSRTWSTSTARARTVSIMTAPIHTVLYCVLTGARVRGIEFRYVHLSRVWLEVTVSLDSDEVGVLVSEVREMRHPEPSSVWGDGRRHLRRQVLLLKDGVSVSSPTTLGRPRDRSDGL